MYRKTTDFCLLMESSLWILLIKQIGNKFMWNSCGRIPSTLGSLSLFLSRSSANWMRSIHVIEGNLLYIKSMNYEIIFPATSMLVFDQTARCHNKVELTHKTNHTHHHSFINVWTCSSIMVKTFRYLICNFPLKVTLIYIWMYTDPLIANIPKYVSKV